jgi:hypothetical protein
MSTMRGSPQTFDINETRADACKAAVSHVVPESDEVGLYKHHLIFSRSRCARTEKEGVEMPPTSCTP